jgi:hypothetical protein
MLIFKIFHKNSNLIEFLQILLRTKEWGRFFQNGITIELFLNTFFSKLKFLY